MEPADTPSETPFLDRLASADLTARERDVACFYEDRLPGAALLNLEEVCQGVGVSSATVARFARKLGYADFRDMTRSLRTRVRHDLSLPVERLRRLGDGGVPGRTVLGHRAALAQEAVSGVLACVDDEVLGRVGALVADADRPLYLGAVASGQPLLHYFGLLLSYLRGGVTVLDGTDRWAHALAGLDARAVVLAAAGIHPERAVAVNLDCGTDNELLLNDPAYLGNRHARVRGARYDALIDEYLAVVSELFPGALLHFEDFGPANARRILQANRERYRVFNDDMQGTGAIVMAAVVSGMRVTGQTFADQRLVVYGAGTAGTGMADQIHAGMVRDGLSPEEATARIWLVDRAGLVTDDMTGLPDYQRAYARPAAEAADWQRSSRGAVELLEVVRRARPTVLIGTSTNHGAFTREVVEAVSAGVERPIILPLSNPTERIEAMPEDVIAWSGGKALVATGIPVAPFDYEGTTFTIGQGNNALLYPGLGLGVIVSGASRVTDGMLLAAAQAVASQVDPTEPGASLLPPVENLRASSATVAVAVARQAQADGVATASHDNLVQAVQDAMWQPVYGELA